MTKLFCLVSLYTPENYILSIFQPMQSLQARNRGPGTGLVFRKKCFPAGKSFGGIVDIIDLKHDTENSPKIFQ